MTFIPERLFEQDFLVFLSFFGWMLIGLLAWTKPLAERDTLNIPWLWFGYFSFAHALAEFIRALSFSDPFFREFNIGSAFEMLGYGALVDFALRCDPSRQNKGTPPYAAIAGLLLGLAIESNAVLYSRIVAFLIVVGSCSFAAACFYKEGKKQGRWELLVVAGGLLMLVPSWLLGPDRWSTGDGAPSLASYSELPYFGFTLLLMRIGAVWVILSGFWWSRLALRIDEVTPQIRDHLRFWGYRVMPMVLGGMVCASFLVTRWNGRRVEESMRKDYLFRSQAAALAMAGLPVKAMLELKRVDPGYREALDNRLLDIKSIGTDILNVYIWQGDSDSVSVLTYGGTGRNSPLIQSVYRSLKGDRGFLRGQALLIGPVLQDSRSVINLSSPALDPETGRPAYWLGIDLAGGAWIKEVSKTRVQTIIICCLAMALFIVFLYYQIDHESKADLALAKERAEAGDRAKSEFLAVISHEIRTPLQSVLGYSDLLRGTRLNEKQMACLDTIQSEGKILLRIVQDILDFSNLRKANIALKEDTVLLRRLIEETYKTIRPMADRKGLVAALEIDEGVPNAIRTDSVRLRQVLLNLFGNSVKYTDKGSVKLSAISRKSTEKGRSAVEFVIADTGIGIKKSDLARLFEPFIQLEHTSHFGREGAGLGLAIVKRIVELMGGKITVKSEEGVGSTFSAAFEFQRVEEAPVAVDTAKELEEAQELASLGARFPLNVLVADDNPMVRRLIDQYLRSLGYQADLVDGGKEASEKGPAYDLVVMDLRMPEMDGPTAASIIRKRTGLDDQPWIIGVSATLAEAEIERALSMGINDFLGKPFFVEGLYERIRAIPWLDRPSDDVEEAEPAAEPENPVVVPEPEALPGGGFGMFPAEVIDGAVAETNDLRRQIADALAREDFPFVSEKAHYLANSAMAIGIDRLFADSKALENAADLQQGPLCAELLDRLGRNFESWDAARRR